MYLRYGIFDDFDLWVTWIGKLLRAQFNFKSVKYQLVQFMYQLFRWEFTGIALQMIGTLSTFFIL